MRPIKSIIIDDEIDSRASLGNYIKKYTPQVEILDECSNIIEAKKSISKWKPQLIFLDIEMPHGNAFDLLEQFDHIDFEIIFVTAFSQYAIQAFNLSASSYLLKPIDIDELEQAVTNVENSIQQKHQFSKAQILMENMKVLKSQNRKLVLPLMDGFDVVKMTDILYCEADDNFTCFYFRDGRKTMICRNLKFYEKALSPYGFYRIHRSNLVNLEYIQHYKKGKGGSVILENKKELMVSANKKAGLMKAIEEWVET